MEWLILLLLVPAILVPIVLLFGFAGCKFERHDPDPPPPPLAPSVTPTPISVSEIDVTWTNPDSNPATGYHFVRTGGTLPPKDLQLPGSTTSVNDTGLAEGTEYTYSVTTTTVTGDSDPTTVPASTFGQAFTAAPVTPQSGLEGFCIVQRIEPPRLERSGARVKITIRGSTAQSLIDRIFISQPAASGDPYDAAADLTLVASSVVVPANQSVPLPAILYALDRTKPLLIAFDITPVPGSGNAIFLSPVPAADAAMFFRPATAEAAIPDRLPSAANPGAAPYQPSPSIYFVERIEVATP